MDLSVIDTPTLQIWHSEAISAFHTISTTGQEVSVSFSTPGSSRSGTWGQVDREALRRYIAQLADELAGRGILAQQRRRRAIGLRF